MHQCPYFLACHHLLQVAHNIHVEDIDRKVIVLTHADGGEVHHLQATGEDFLVGNLRELSGCGVFLRISSIDAIHTGALQHDVGFDFNTTQGGTCIRGEIRITRSC